MSGLSPSSAAPDSSTQAGVPVSKEARSPAVVLYAPSFNALGGGEVWLNRIANGLADRDWRVVVIGKQKPRYPVPHEWRPTITKEYLAPEDEDERLVRGPRAVLRLLTRSPLADVARVGLDRLLRGWRPKGAFLDDLSPDGHRRLVSVIDRARGQSGDDPIIVCTDVYTGSHVASARKLGLLTNRYFVMHHNSFDSLSRGTARAYRRATRDAVGLIALTDEDADKFRRFGLHRVLTMHNPSPRAGSEQVGPRPSEPMIVTWLARMTKVKAGDVAIKAWARIADEYPGWRLDMWGDGPERRRLEDLVSALDLSRSVRFRGVADRPEVVFAASDINLLTSRFEGWALVIGEAAMQGVPTVAADNSPGVRLQIEDGVNGMLVPVGNDRATARALAALMGSETGRTAMGALARQRSADFDIDLILDAWEAVLKAA